MNRVARAGLTTGVVGALLLGVGLYTHPRQALISCLASFGFALGVALGALLYAMIGYASGARWFVVLRRFTEVLALTIVPLSLFAIPILLGARWLYPWARPEAITDPEVRELLHRKQAYLNLPFFQLRSCFYFAVWITLAWLLRRGSSQRQTDRAAPTVARLRVLSSVSLPIVGLTLTFAAFDWFMSLEPAWYSTAYGLYYFTGGFAGAVAATTLTAYVARRQGFLPEAVAESHFHAFGRLQLASVALWAYVGFFQFMLIWLADLPEEVVWYKARLRGGWGAVAIALVIGHFVLPFFALLQRSVTRRPERLAAVSAWVLLMHFVDTYWLVVPALHREGPRPHWLDLAGLLAVNGAVVAFVSWQFSAAPRITADGTEVAASLRYESP